MKKKMNAVKSMISKCRRKSDRLALKLSIEFKTLSSKKWSSQKIIDNISGGGLCFKSSGRIKINTKLKLKINILTRDTPIQADAKVMWCKNDLSMPKKKKTTYIVGIEFLNMTDEDRHAFVSYLCEEILFHYLSNNGKVKPKWT